MKVPFYISNVFAESAWGGNPLAIVPLLDGDIQLDTQTMQRIARQFNLSETVFITPPRESGQIAHLRIFTAENEMPFAGHPTIGAAQWLHQQFNLSDSFTLSTEAKIVQIQNDAGIYRFTLSGYESAACGFSNEHLTQALGLRLGDVDEGARWMNAGTWQLIIRVNSREAVFNAQPDIKQLSDPDFPAVHANTYIWHEIDGQVTSRYFFSNFGCLDEDPGTGSACANLGAWAHQSGFAPFNWKITQAEAIDRASCLYLNVATDGNIQVGGRVMPFAKGELSID